MLVIRVNSKPLYIPAGTALTMEQSASWDDIDNISADIVWTFDIPAEPNAAVLDQVGYTIASNHKRYPCDILFGGIPIARGSLYVMHTSDQQTISCGAILNQLTEGWAGRFLSDNAYSPASLPIADSAANYQPQWFRFLKQTLSADSIVKFFLFCSQNFLEANPDYGILRHAGDDNEIYAHLENSNAANMMSKWVNRFFTDADGNILQSPDMDAAGNPCIQGVRVFNSLNSFHYAPAISLPWLIRQVFADAGMTVVGSFIDHPAIQKLFVQSMHAMDGNILQFPIVQQLSLTGAIAPASDAPAYLSNTFPVDVNYSSAQGFSLSGNTSGINANFRLLLPCIDLLSRPIVSGPMDYDKYDEAYFLVLRTDLDTPLPTHRANLNSNLNATPRYIYGNVKSSAQLQADLGQSLSQAIPIDYADVVPSTGSTPYHLLSSPASAVMLQLTPTTYSSVSFGSSDTEVYTGAASLATDLLVGAPASARYYAQLVKAKVNTFSEVMPLYHLRTSDGLTATIQCLTAFSAIEELTDYEVIDSSQYDYCEPYLNVYASHLPFAQHVPHLTNAEFVKALCQFFGLVFYPGSDAHEAQLSFFKDIFASQSLDIAPYVVSERKLAFDHPTYRLRVTPVETAADADDSRFLPDVSVASQLPLPQTRQGRYAFVASENRHRLAENSDDGSGTPRWSWAASRGTRQSVIIGDNPAEAEEVSTSIQVPNMRITDAQHTPKYVCEVSSPGCSPMFQPDFKGEFPCILQQYRGRRLLQLQSPSLFGISEAYIEDANPTWFNQDGTIDQSAINLTADGAQSVGRMWQQPLYGFLSQREQCELVLRIPVAFFLQLYRLLQPQPGPESMQVRWLSYRSQRYLPSSISYQFSDSDSIVATIQCSRV